MSTGTPEPPVPSTNVRVVTLRLRTVLIGLGIVLGVLAALEFVLRAQKGLTLIAIALFLAIAINPAVEFFQHRGLGRGMAVAIVSSSARRRSVSTCSSGN